MTRSIAIVCGLALLAGCTTGACAPERDGPESGYVSDVEHDPVTGAPLTGLPLVWARLTEAVASPFCAAGVTTR